MLTDYRSPRDLNYLAKPRRRSPFLRPKLLLPVFCAGVVYASLQFLGGNEAGAIGPEITTHSSIETRLALPGQSDALSGDDDSAFAASSESLDITLPMLSAAEDTTNAPEAEAVKEASGFLTVEDTAEATLATMQADIDTGIQIALPLPEPTPADQPTESQDFGMSGGNTVVEQENLESASLDPLPEELAGNDDDQQLAPEQSGPDSLSDIQASGKWLEEKVKPGDSLARIFSRLELSASLLHRVVNSSKKAKSLARIKPGQIIRVRLDEQDNFQELVLRRSAIKSLRILPVADGFQAMEMERSLEKHVAQTSGTITDSLYQSAKRENLTDTLIMELANIFGWDIDFALEIRAGDQFSLIYEEEYLDGEKYRNGPILAAEFINRGQVFRAIRYEDEKGNIGYFSPDGHSMRKTFLRAPVDFRRISSRFTKARWHPVLGKKRPHRGVDYSASIGTPIKAAGDGKVIYRGKKGGYGNTVIIQHGSQYTTLYAHMSKYRRGVTNGSRVKQGQVIGYVGKSGLATGPHLHYEFRINGAHRNPLKVKLPAAAPIAKQYRADFSQKSAPLLAQLDTLSKTMVAEAE